MGHTFTHAGIKSSLMRSEQKLHFCTHGRDEGSITVEPERVIIAEGILLFALEEMRDLFDIRVFVDTGSDLRLLRRILRDIKERGRDLEGVANQYLETVRPMYKKYVEPARDSADIIVSGEGGIDYEDGIQAVLEQLRQRGC